MALFPKHLLKPLRAEILQVEGELAQFTFLDVFFESISDIPPHGDEFDGMLRLGYIRLPSKDVVDLADQSFEFPTRCELKGAYPGMAAYECIEGSVYLGHAAAPVYVSRLEFGTPVSGKMPLRIESYWDLPPDALELDPFSYTFDVTLALNNAPSPPKSSQGSEPSILSGLLRRLNDKRP